MNKYLKDNRHRIDIKKDVIYENSFFIQLKKNLIALTFVKNAYIHEKFKHINVIYYHVRDLHVKN